MKLVPSVLLGAEVPGMDFDVPSPVPAVLSYASALVLPFFPSSFELPCSS